MIYEQYLKHFLDELVDLFFSVAPVSVFMERVVLVVPASTRVVKFERPQEVVGLFEVGSYGGNLLDQVFDGSDADFAQVLFDDGVVGNRNSVSGHSDKTSFVQQLRNGASSRVSVCNIRFDSLQHVQTSFVDTDEHSVVELSQTEQTEDLFDLRVDFVNTKQNRLYQVKLPFESDHKCNFRFCGHIKRSRTSGNSSFFDQRL